MRYGDQLVSLYKHHIIRKVDFDECESDTATLDTPEEPFEPYEHPAWDLSSILHPIGPAAQYLRHMVTQCLHVHLSRWIYHMQSMSRTGHKWREAGYHVWVIALENLCEYCIRKMFRQKDQRDILHRALLNEVHDSIRNSLDEESVWSELIFYPDYTAMLTARVHSW